MKKTLTKVLICFLVFLVLFNFTLASEAYNNTPAEGSMGAITAENAFNTIYNLLVNILGAFVGFAFWGLRIGVFAVVAAVQVLISGIVSLGGVTESGIMVTPFTIFFNQVPLLDVDFMDFNSPSSAVNDFRTQVATWYYILRIIATAILLLILIYIGIRMAISTMAQDKVIYKKMLVDWATSLALLYLLHYFIIFITKLNSSFVEILKGVGGAEDYVGNFIDYALTVALQSISVASGFNGIVSLIVYALIIWQTLKFLLLYLKRMITIGFLIIISPLITITYSIDKIGDQRAQALNTWMKEFCYNILIQPFHCIMYLAFVNVAISLIEPSALETMFNLVSFVPGLNVLATAGNAIVNTVNGSNTLAAGILAVVCINFVDDGEKIIRKIFGFEKASSLDSAVAAAATVGALASKAGDLGKKASKLGISGKNMFKGTMGRVSKDLNRFGNVAKGVANSNTPIGAVARGIGKGASTVQGAAKAVASVPGKVSSKISNSKAYKAVRGSVKSFEKARSEFVNGKDGNGGRAKELAVAAGKNWDNLDETEKENYRQQASVQYTTENAFSKNIGNVIASSVKSSIKGVRGNISSHLHDREYLSTVAGASAGLAMYGLTSNNAIASLIIGMGAKEGANEFLKSTKGQLAGGAFEAMQETTSVTGKEYKTKEEKLSHMQAVKFAGDNGKYSESKVADELKNLVSTLQSLMQGLSQQQIHGIAADMQNKLVANPNNFNFEDEFKNSMEKHLGKDRFDNMSDESKQEAEDQMKKFMTTFSNARLYNTLKLADEAGLNPEDIVEKVSDTHSAPREVHHYRIEREETTVTYSNQEVISEKINEVNTAMRNMETATQSNIDSIVDGLNSTISSLESSRNVANDRQRTEIDGLRLSLEQRLREVENKNNIRYKDNRP